MPDSLFTAAARLHIGKMVRELAPITPRLQRRYRKSLRDAGFDSGPTRDLLAILPVASLPLRSFQERVNYHGRRLAKFNITIAQVDALLREFDALASESLDGRFAPVREQLLLATLHNLHLAFYEVREAEAQAFFGIYRAESEAAGLEDLLRRFVGVVTRTFRARAGRLALSAPSVPCRPLYLKRGQRAKRWIVDAAMHDRFASYWSYPLASGGAIQLAFAKPYPWLPRELALLEAVAARCEEAIQRSLSEQAIRRLEAQAHAAEEEERRRIGRELHDEAGQSLLVLRLRLELIEREAPEELRARVGEAREIAGSIILELRRIIAALSPAVLERLGLESALRQLAARFRKNHPGSLRVRISINGTPLSKGIQEAVYRVAQESLQNVAKHSGAAHVNLSLLTADRRIRLSVSDDGAGFCVESAQIQPMSFGLAGMRERAALLGGSLAIRSAPSKGTTVTLELP